METQTTIDEAVLRSFAETGIVKLTGVFSADAADAMREVVWRDLYHTDGVRRDDRSTWHRKTPLRKLARAKRDPVFRALFGEPLRQLADALLGPSWTSSDAFGNLLVSFPDAERWHLPGRDGFWHADCLNIPAMDPIPSLRVFAVFGDMRPGGGGTLLGSGTGPVVARYIRDHPDAPRSHKPDVAWHVAIPWLKELTLTELPRDRSPDDDERRRRRFMEAITDFDGTPLQVVEACGDPGDVYVCHPFTVHCKPPNASDRPRMLRAPTLSRNA